MKKLALSIVFLLFGSAFTTQGSDALYRSSTAWVHFVSDAPLELIEAHSTALRGILNVRTNSFAFRVPIRSFQGFNSPLQQEHFNENYMESNRYPAASFQGKIIEDVNLRQAGTYVVRAKGMLDLHGVPKERIIPCTLKVSEQQVLATANFLVPLNDHNISIPKLVYHKIADNIQVSLEAHLQMEE